eukprot:354912-Chlamydomonas_euryale.AAC.2
MTLESAQEVKRMSENKVKEAQDGWATSRVHIMPADLPTNGARKAMEKNCPGGVAFDLQHVNMLQFLKEEYGNKEYRGHFATHASRRYDKDGNVLFGGDVHEADTWTQMEEDLRRSSGNVDAVIAALQLYSDKTLLFMKGEA